MIPKRRAILATFCLVSACSGPSQDNASRASEQGPTPLASIPYESCALAPTAEARAVAVASIAPQAVDWEGARSVASWAPTSVTAVAVIGDTLVVLDGPQAQVTAFNGTLNPIATFGGPGEGPGEFRRATALTILGGNRIGIVDAGTKRLTMLTPEFKLGETRSIPVGQLASAAAFSGEELYLSQDVMVEMAVRNPALGEALSLIPVRADGSTTVLRLVPGTPAADSLLRLPGPNPFRVVASGHSLLFLAPAAGIVDLYRDGARVARLRTCMPPMLDKALQQQRAAYRPGTGSGAQQDIPLVSDAIVVADTVFLVGPVPDAGGRLHIDAFLVDGTPVGSVLVNTSGLGLPREMRFWGTPDQLVAYGADGVIVKLRIEGRTSFAGVAGDR